MTSSIKGFLCSQDGTYNFPLMPKLTTIGRENCEILINVCIFLYMNFRIANVTKNIKFRQIIKLDRVNK